LIQPAAAVIHGRLASELRSRSAFGSAYRPLRAGFPILGVRMDRGERRHRTKRIIDRRIRSRVFETGGPLYASPPIEPWRRRFLYRVTVGSRKYWTFHEWLAKPGILRKVNGAHGCCGVCEQEENPKRGEPTLAWELEQLCEEELKPAPSLDRLRSPGPCGRRSRKDTRRWCRGKAGVPHRTAWQPVRPGSDSYELICSVCGKKLDWCCHASWWRRKDPCRCGMSARVPSPTGSR
jgi:hypothetical protein